MWNSKGKSTCSLSAWLLSMFVFYWRHMALSHCRFSKIKEPFSCASTSCEHEHELKHASKHPSFLIRLKKQASASLLAERPRNNFIACHDMLKEELMVHFLLKWTMFRKKIKSWWNNCSLDLEELKNNTRRKSNEKKNALQNWPMFRKHWLLED